MNVFEAVKQSVITRQAAERYGIKVNRNGMCVCPFHNDKNPSMKVDRRFYCFGCGATGDVIDFVSRLHGIGSKEAALMLAQDFSIPYEDGRNAGKPPIRPRLRRETEEQKFKRMERHCFRALSDYYHLLRRRKEEYAPRQPDEAWTPPVYGSPAKYEPTGIPDGRASFRGHPGAGRHYDRTPPTLPPTRTATTPSGSI